VIGLLADTYHDRYFTKSDEFGGTQAALASNELISALQAASWKLYVSACDDKRLENAILSNRLRQRLETRLIKLTARLVRIWLDTVNFNPED
jgi:hypothetical protein